MFVAYVGDDGLVHRVASAVFENKVATGAAFCDAKGEVTFAPNSPMSCEKCRATLLTSAVWDHSLFRKRRA